MNQKIKALWKGLCRVPGHKSTLTLATFIMACLCYTGTASNENDRNPLRPYIPLVDSSPALTVEEIGVPVRSVTWVRLHPGRDDDGKPVIYATMGQVGGELFLLQINPLTGQFKQFQSSVKNANYPTTTLVSRSGSVYIGATHAGHLLRFDPDKEILEDLGSFREIEHAFVCRLDEDRQGRIWIGSFDNAELAVYNPSTGKITQYGRMDETDLYCYPYVNVDGMIVCDIKFSRQHVLIFNPATGERRKVGPTAEADKDKFEVLKDAAGQVYIKSSLGNYRIEGMTAVPIDKVPDPPAAPTLPDGSTFAFIDENIQRNRTLEVRKPDGTVRQFELDYKTDGTEIHYLHTGPDGLLYGSSMLPEHFFRYNPKSGELLDLGVCSTATGEAYSMANLDGKIYIGSYPKAMLSVYDPALPYHIGLEPGDNPREVGRIDERSNRPRSALAGPLGRVWFASRPEYGFSGGPLAWYDPATESRHSYFGLAGKGSCFVLAHLPEERLLAVGTSRKAGAGIISAEQAQLFLWDYEGEKKVWEGTLGRPVFQFNALHMGADNRLYGTAFDKNGAPPEFFVFDTKKRVFIERHAVPGEKPLDLGLQQGPDGNIYGVTKNGIYRYDPSTSQLEVIYRDTEEIYVAGPIMGQWMYLSTLHRLRAVKLF